MAKWHGGKGSTQRPETEQGAYASGWDAIFGAKAKAEPACGTCETPIKPDPMTGTTCECDDGRASDGTAG